MAVEPATKPPPLYQRLYVRCQQTRQMGFRYWLLTKRREVRRWYKYDSHKLIQLVLIFGIPIGGVFWMSTYTNLINILMLSPLTEDPNQYRVSPSQVNNIREERQRILRANVKDSSYMQSKNY